MGLDNNAYDDGSDDNCHDPEMYLRVSFVHHASLKYIRSQILLRCSSIYLLKHMQHQESTIWEASVWEAVGWS